MASSTNRESKQMTLQNIENQIDEIKLQILEEIRIDEDADVRHLNSKIDYLIQLKNKLGE